MSVQISYKEGVMTARLSGEIDHHSAREMREAIDDTAQKLKPYCLRLDFTRVPFMDSSGVGIILGRYRKISCFGGKVYAVNAGSRIRRLLLLSGLENIVELIEQ